MVFTERCTPSIIKIRAKLIKRNLPGKNIRHLKQCSVGQAIKEIAFKNGNIFNWQIGKDL